MTTKITPFSYSVDDEGNIHFTLTSDASIDPRLWEDLFTRGGYQFGDQAREVLLYATHEKPTHYRTYEVVVLRGKTMRPENLVTKNIYDIGNKRGLIRAHWEVACLIHINLTRKLLKEMGLQYIATMHSPIKDSRGELNTLQSECYGGKYVLVANHFLSAKKDLWNDEGGFALVKKKTR